VARNARGSEIRARCEAGCWRGTTVAPARPIGLGTDDGGVHAMLKFLGNAVGIVFIIGLIVVIGILALVF
jgi:hypothetical protein